MRFRTALIGCLATAGGCSLDQAGARPPEGDGGGSSGDAVAGSTSSSASSAGSTGAGDPSGPGSGGAPTGQGGDAQGTGGTGGPSTSDGGGASQGGSGGAGGIGGTGGDSTGGGGAGGEGTGGLGGTGGQGGAGGAPPECGNGTLESGEECETQDGDDCDDVSCQWLGSCGDDIAEAFVPGGVLRAGDTSQQPNVADFGVCQDNGAAPVQLYEYTTGPEPAYLEVLVVQDPVGLANPILSLHTSCTDSAVLTCLFPGTTGPCCIDSAAGADEVLLTDVLQPFSTLEVAVSGFQDGAGAYDVRFRELRYLLVERFDSGVGSFTIDSGWAPAADCVGGTTCVGVVGDAANPDENLISPSFSAANVGSVLLQWFHWVDNSTANPNDQQIVEVSTDGGSTWTMVYAQADAVDEWGLGKQVDISVVAGSPDVRVRFHYADAGGIDFAWYVEDVFVIAW